MKWPLPQEINEAIQTPAVSFADPDLKGGEVVVGASGLPLPRSGNFADVYQIRGADGREWAVKCFTRPVVGLDNRYEAVAAALSALGLPFIVRFTYLTDGLRVSGRWYPVVKMDWVEGHQLQQFARLNLTKPAALDALVGMWAKLSRRLRDAGIAHGDLQHGNVLLVAGSKPGSFGLKLIDYDGMYVPALANRPSGEVGHPSYQHPQRADQKAYSPDLDRFPHLVVATALKALAVMGPGLWDRYDNGDNLLFTEADLRNPAGSSLLRELWQSGHREVRALAGRLAVACHRPIPQTPWLDQVAPDGVVRPLSVPEEKAAIAALGLAAPASVPAARPREAIEFDQQPPIMAHRSGVLVPLILAGLILAVIGGVSAGVYLLAFAGPAEVVQAPPDEPEPPPPEPELAPPPRSAPVEPSPAPPPPTVAQVNAEPEVIPPPRAVVVPPVEPVAPRRFPVPGNAAAAKSEAELREVYKTEFARRTAADRKALAEKLLDLAGKTPDDVVARYVMLRTARDLAVEAADPHLMAKATDELGALYEVDGAEMKAAGLEKILPLLTRKAALRAVVDVAQAGIESAIDQDSYDAAVQFAVVAAQATRKGLLGPVDEVDSRLVQVRRLRDGFATVKTALEVLKQNPADPDANLTVGRYRCFVQGRWPEGVKHLARGSNPLLKAAAELEQAPAPDGAALAKVGDAWWDFAQSAPDPADKRAAETRARSWYTRAVSDLTGLALAKAQSRLELTVGGVVYRPGLVVESQRGPVFDGKRSRVDAGIDFDGRELERQGNTGSPLQLQWTGVIVPEKPGRYRLVLTLSRETDAARVSVNRLPVIDTMSARTAKGRRFEAGVILTERPNTILVEYRGPNQPGSGIKLLWVPPGLNAVEEVIPAAVLFHDRNQEAGTK